MNTNNAVQLQDKIDGHDIYPITLASLVQTTDGSNLEDGKADKSDVYTKSLIDTLLGNKLNSLVSGTNIKTINNSSLLGSGNLLLAGLDKETHNSIIYEALKQGLEQMLVLKSMGDLDIVPLDASLDEFDLNGDGAINYAEISILYSIFLGEPYEGFYYRAIHLIEGDSASPIILQKSEDNTNWVTVTDKNPDITGDGNITAADITELYNIILDTATQLGIVYDRSEFTGGTTVFSAYDPKDKKIVIGYNFERYIDPTYNKNDYILLKLDPSPNVIYCNSFNNKLHRWNAHTKQMIELNISTITTTSIVGDLLNRVEQLEILMEDYGGDVNIDDPATPAEPLNP